MLRTQDLRVLFRAQEIISQLATEGLAVVPILEPVIGIARQKLETQKGRRRYLLEMLPDSVAHALPEMSGEFFVEFSQAGSLELHDGFPVLIQILELERRQGERAIRLLHYTGVGFKDREYWL